MLAERMYARWRRQGLPVLGTVVVLSVACARSAWGGTAPAYDTMTVHTGQTVWGIAAQRYPEADTREKVGEILAANGLHDPTIRPGQRLRVPAR
jgi:nucleoid-associated protein YgaU